MKKLLTLIGVAALLATVNLQAAQQTQTSTNALLITTTNTIAIPGDVTGLFTNGETISGNTVVDGSKTTQMLMEVGGFFTNTAAASSNVTFRVASSVTGQWWTNSIVVTVAVPASSTNYAATQFTVSLPYSFYSLRTIENLAGAGAPGKAGTMYLKAVTKTGL